MVVLWAVFALPRFVIQILGFREHTSDVVFMDYISSNFFFPKAGVGLDFREHFLGFTIFVK